MALLAAHRIFEVLDDKQLVSTIVNNLDRDLLVLARLKWRAHGAGQMIPYAFFVCCFQRLLDVVPGRCARKKYL